MKRFVGSEYIYGGEPIDTRRPKCRIIAGPARVGHQVRHMMSMSRGLLSGGVRKGGSGGSAGSVMLMPRYDRLAIWGGYQMAQP